MGEQGFPEGSLHAYRVSLDVDYPLNPEVRGGRSWRVQDLTRRAYPRRSVVRRLVPWLEPHSHLASPTPGAAVAAHARGRADAGTQAGAREGKKAQHKCAHEVQKQVVHSLTRLLDAAASQAVLRAAHRAEAGYDKGPTGGGAGTSRPAISESMA